MAEYKTAQRERSEWRQKLFIGVEIPLPWLISIVAMLCVNAGILYSQFNDVKEQVSKFARIAEVLTTRVEGIERRADGAEARDIRITDRQNAFDSRLDDHERRIRDVERKPK